MHQDVLPLDRPEVQHRVEAAAIDQGVGFGVPAFLAFLLREYVDHDRLVIRPKQFVQVFATCREQLLRPWLTHGTS